MLSCICTVLLANTQWADVHGGPASQWADVKGQPTTAELSSEFIPAYTRQTDQDSPTRNSWGATSTAELTRQHAALPPPATAPATLPDTGEHLESSPNSLPAEIFQSARLGELQEVVKWQRKGGPVELQLITVRPQPSARSTLPQPTATW